MNIGANLIRKVTNVSLIITFSFGVVTTALALENQGTGPKVNSQFNPYLQMADINLFEKMIFRREKGELKDPIKSTWEGILSLDSPERLACKQICLDDYGVETPKTLKEILVTIQAGVDVCSLWIGGSFTSIRPAKMII